MKEETLLILRHINSKIEEVKEKHNIDNGTCFVIPIGNCADYGYISHEMIKDILQTQQRIDKAIEYINKYKQIFEIDGSKENMLDEFNILASPKKLIDILGGKQ